jgi:hypothetical protein
VNLKEKKLYLYTFVLKEIYYPSWKNEQTRRNHRMQSTEVLGIQSPPLEDRLNIMDPPKLLSVYLKCESKQGREGRTQKRHSPTQMQSSLLYPKPQGA